MSRTRYRDLSIFSKIMGISLACALLLVTSAIFLVPFIGDLLLKEKEHALASNLEQVTSLLASYQKGVLNGSLTPEEARRRGAERITDLRYDGGNYFWVQDTAGRMIVHPLKPELNGKDLSREKDINGVTFLAEMGKVARDRGKGSLRYLWPKPGNDRPVKKLSCVELFRPWGWVVGTGIYIDDVDAQLRAIGVGIAAVLCLMLGITLSLSFWIARSITVPVALLVGQARRVADGELNIEIHPSSADEVGELSRSFEKMIESLRGIIGRVSDTSSQVAAAAIQLNVTANRIATGAEEAGTQAVTVATASEEMSATSGDIAQNCQLAAEGARQASQSAGNGVQVVERTVAVMNQIAERVQESAATVENLGARSDQIGAIIGTIEDIADQTNLLALNAAIEAARAGEQGRGFAVVADEVRALAERTTRATREIGEMIKTIQRETRGAVSAMEQGVLQVEQGTAEAARSGEALQDILAQVNAATEQVSRIATAAEEQTATTTEISRNMQKINQVVGETAGCAHEAATVATQLNGNAAELQRLVRQFRL